MSENNEFFIKEKLKLISTLENDGIQDKKVLNAISEVPRQLFISKDLENLAYSNKPLPIDCMQTISQPYIVAFMTQEAKIDLKSKVLEIGTGSGYQAAILSKLCKEVFTIEVIKELSEKSKILLQQLNYKNIHTKCSNGYLGWIEESPFDAIIVTAAAKEFPTELVSQLKLYGRIIIPLEMDQYSQILCRITKTSVKNDFELKKLLDVRFVPMVNTDNV